MPEANRLGNVLIAKPKKRRDAWSSREGFLLMCSRVKPKKKKKKNRMKPRKASPTAILGVAQQAETHAP